jgi:hypothetical protein
MTWTILQGDALEVLRGLPRSSIHCIVTSPPYWNMLATSRGGVESTQKQRKKQGLDTVYSADARDLGNIADYDDYVATLAKVFADLNPVLADKAYLVIILQNCRPKDGIMKPLAWRPSPLIELAGCRDVRIDNITIRRSPVGPCGPRTPKDQRPVSCMGWLC